MSLQPFGGGWPYWVVVFKPNVWVWNSNRYTLDYVLEEAYYQVFPDPTKLPLPVQVWWTFDGNNPKVVLDVAAYGSGTYFNYHQTPPAPPGWWDPPEL